LRRYVLLAVVCHTQSHLIAAAEVRVGPTNESPLFEPLLDEAVPCARWDRLLADAAYDAEHHHATAREDCFIRATIIPINRRRQGRAPSTGGRCGGASTAASTGSAGRRRVASAGTSASWATRSGPGPTRRGSANATSAC
jgi:Transposase DDE domain